VIRDNNIISISNDPGVTVPASLIAVAALDGLADHRRRDLI